MVLTCEDVFPLGEHYSINGWRVRITWHAIRRAMARYHFQDPVEAGVWIIDQLERASARRRGKRLRWTTEEGACFITAEQDDELVVVTVYRLPKPNRARTVRKRRPHRVY